MNLVFIHIISLSMSMLFWHCLFILLPLSSSLRLANQNADEGNADEASSKAEVPTVSEMLCSTFPQPKIAVCFHGSARSFPNSIVHRSQKQNLIDALGADITTFLHVTRKDARGDAREGFGGAFPEAKMEHIQKAADHLGILEKRMKILEGPNAEIPHCPNYHENYQARNDSGDQWFRGMNGVYSLAGQLSHKEGCMNLIREEEARTQKTFDEVILTRADLTFYSAMQPYCFFNHNNGRKYRDWYFHVGRKTADQIFSVPYQEFFGCKTPIKIGQTVERYVYSKVGPGMPGHDDGNLHIMVTRLDQSNMPNSVCGKFHTIYSNEVDPGSLCGPVTYQNPFNTVGQ